MDISSLYEYFGFKGYFEFIGIFEQNVDSFTHFFHFDTTEKMIGVI